MRRTLTCLIALLVLFPPLWARAGVLEAPGTDLEVSLMTYGPGAIYWERFGHDAIRLRDRVSGESAEFNYGVFDFEDKSFMWNFARGHMRYMLDAEHGETDQQDFVDEGRLVIQQVLALSPQQAQNLRAFLLWNMRPENLTYDYDYLTDNCATRVRDALNRALDGALKPILSATPAPLTYRQQIDRLMSPERLLMLGMDLGLGPSSDRPLNEWQESFIPMVLQRELRRVRVRDEHGNPTPLVVSEAQLAPNHVQPPPDEPLNLDVPLGIAGLILAAILVVSRRLLPTLHAVVAITYLLFAGIVGLLLIALWTLTAHHGAWANGNLLVFNPVALAMLGAAWGTRRNMRAGSLVRWLSVCQLGAALLALLFHFLGVIPQQNLPWLLFATPVWLAIAFGLFAL